MSDLERNGRRARRGAMALGACLLCVAAFGFLESVRAGVAHGIRRAAGDCEDDARTLRLCSVAYRIYPKDYYVCILGARSAFKVASEAESTGDEMGGQAMIAEADVWCDRGLALNGYERRLNRMKADAVWERAPRQALERWETYTDWAYWHPYNHAVLSMFYTGVWEFEKAERALEMARGSNLRPRARQMLDRARAEIMSKYL